VLSAGPRAKTACGADSLCGNAVAAGTTNAPLPLRPTHLDLRETVRRLRHVPRLQERAGRRVWARQGEIVRELLRLHRRPPREVPELLQQDSGGPRRRRFRDILRDGDGRAESEVLIRGLRVASGCPGPGVLYLVHVPLISHISHVSAINFFEFLSKVEQSKSGCGNIGADFPYFSPGARQ